MGGWERDDLSPATDGCTITMWEEGQRRGEGGKEREPSFTTLLVGLSKYFFTVAY